MKCVKSLIRTLLWQWLSYDSGAPSARAWQLRAGDSSVGTSRQLLAILMVGLMKVALTLAARNDLAQLERCTSSFQNSSSVHFSLMF